MRLAVLPGALAVCRLEPRAAVPAWVVGLDGPVVSLTRTAHELSIVAPAGRVPDDAVHEGPWTALAVEGPLDFALVGVLAQLSTTLAAASSRAACPAGPRPGRGGSCPRASAPPRDGG